MASPTEPLAFKAPYAILNLDLMTVLIDAVKNTPKGQALISNCNAWIDAVHARTPRPLTILSTLAITPGQPEVTPDSPFARLLEPFGDFARGSLAVQISKHFKVDKAGGDIVVEKTRWSAMEGNALEQILRASGIKTVIISGLTLTGVVMATVYRLFDLDYDVYVIRDNVLDIPVDDTEPVSRVMLDGVLPKMGFSAISLEEALQALERSRSFSGEFNVYYIYVQL
ncbi:Isochorismatase-like protein [Aspergillus keveii]|uniref:Isochorismatase-like protein n=1 Tax=Aspergillus keveii TaxID=714993 RepID=A0ABR4FVJ0_9EURO